MIESASSSGKLAGRISGAVADRRNGYALRQEQQFHGPQGGSTVSDDLIGVLRGHARERAEARAFVYLPDGQSGEVVMTYGELDRLARAIGGRLQEMGLAGERVLLAYPHGLDFIAGFLGCLYGGCTAVPTYLPHRRTLERFGAIVRDAGANLVLSTASAMAQVHDAGAIPWLASE